LCNNNFYDKDYFENGRETKKSWYENYRWMPQRSFREALAFIDVLCLNKDSYVLDVGCSKGFLVKAFRELEVKADGADISDYALSFAPYRCWNCSNENSWEEHKDWGYTHIIAKDMLEHLNKEELEKELSNFAKICNKIMCVVPMGELGRYRIPEYELDQSHIIRENESWWYNTFEMNGWKVIFHTNHVKGIKDNWIHYPDGNHVFVLERLV